MIKHLLSGMFFLLSMSMPCFTFSNDSPTTDSMGQIQINLENLPEKSAGLIVFIYRSKENFLKHPEESFYIPKEAINNNQVVLQNIRFGDLALSVAADMNGNKELDTRIFGIPAEPVGFAGNPKSRFGPPKFSQCVFSFNEPLLNLSINLISI